MEKIYTRLVVSGLIGPLVYALILSILAILEPNYNPITQSMSELGATDAQYAFLTNLLGFPLLGIFLICFTIGIHKLLPAGRISILAPCLLIISSVSLILTGVFRCDPGCIDITLNGKLHSLFASLAAIFMMPVPIAIMPRIYKKENWYNYIWFGLVTMLLTSILSLFYVFPSFANLTGLLQRLSMGVPFFWVMIISIKLFRIQSPQS